MSALIDFNDDDARRLETIYRTPDVVEQRRRTLRALNLQPGERVLDIGTGPGFLLRDMATMVGPQGIAVGCDLSQPMLAMAGKRCADQPWVNFEPGDAASLPIKSESFDAVASIQVYEYVADLATALTELFRVVVPGGRVVIVDTDYDSWVVRTEDPERFSRIRTAWNDHFVHGDLPRRLIPHLRDAGFTVSGREVIHLLNTEYHPDTYSFGMIGMIARFVAGRGEVSADDADGWRTEMEGLGNRGGFFFSLNRYLFVAQKPAHPMRLGEDGKDGRG
jgi:SAM-dependent methyltransferase